MTYENWAECPQCRRNHNDKMAVWQDIVKTQYGEMTKEEYLDALDNINRKFALYETLQELWEIGIVWDDFFVQYSASCEVCGYTYSFSKTEDLNLKGD